jgi:hypothetical protein
LVTKHPPAWTTYGTSIADFHNFKAAQRDMKAPKKKVGQTGSLPIAVFNRAYGAPIGVHDKEGVNRTLMMRTGADHRG